MKKGMPEYSNIRIEEVINEYIHSKRDRSILYEALVNGLSYNRLADEFNLSARHIRKIVQKGKIELSKYNLG